MKPHRRGAYEIRSCYIALTVKVKQQITSTQEDQAMKNGSLTVEQRKQQVQQVQHLKALVTELYWVTGGRGKYWQAAKRAISSSLSRCSA